jgi:hypothetical protein
MPLNDYSSSDSLRVAAKVLSPDDPNNPRNPAFLAAAAQAAREAAAASEIKNLAAQASARAAASAAPSKSQPVSAAPPQQPPKKRRKYRSRRPPASQVAHSETPAERHQRLCTICKHQDCREIEQEFLNWIHPEGIAQHYGVDWRAIYRHAHAKRLFPARQRNLHFALGRMVELASQVTPTMDGMLRTIRAFSSLDRNGRWTEIPTHVVVSSGAQLAQARLSTDSVKSLTLRSVIDAASQPHDAPEDALESDVLIDNVNL